MSLSDCHKYLFKKQDKFMDDNNKMTKNAIQNNIKHDMEKQEKYAKGDNSVIQNC